jgi:lipopolysaccharide transport system ATP-binding protein
MEVIRFENIAKLYRLGQVGTGTLSHDLNRWWAKMRGQEDPFAKVGRVNDRSKSAEKDEYVWALKDVSASIQQGKVVGIIGKNGAGKSTLLKILSRITSPTKGEIKIKGRVASLLEVGTGFHPEMTGRENVYMNGTVLGMKRQEIKSKLDEIVEFAGVAKYLDTPVKRFSSGMTVRLGFAVAAHLDPDILVVDEVLAVGDAEFQSKALGKMQEVSRSEGRTVLFVSHNMASVKQLCTDAICMENGSISYTGDTDTAIKKYMGSTLKNQEMLDLSVRRGLGFVQFTDIKIRQDDNTETTSFAIGDDVNFDLTLVSENKVEDVKVAIIIKLEDGTPIANFNNEDSRFFIDGIFGRIAYRVKLTDIRFYPGKYIISYWVGSKRSHDTYDFLEDIHFFEITDGGSLTQRKLPRSNGLIFLTPAWS